jgi:hypothetical protein
MTMKSKKSGGYSPNHGTGWPFSSTLLAAHEGLEDREEDAAVLRDLALSAHLVRGDPDQGIFREGGEGVVGLVGEDVAVGEEQDARPTGWLTVGFPVAQVPAALEELPGDLEGDEGLARAGGQRQQDALPLVGDGRQHPVDGDVLVVTPLEVPAPVLEGHCGEAVPPRVLDGEGPVPELLRRGEGRQLGLVAGLHVDAVDALPVGGVGMANGKASGVVLGLPHPFGQRLVPGLGLHDGQLGVPVLEDVVGSQGLATLVGPSSRPRVMGYSRRMRLPSTTPHPAALRAGSMCSARVSASFMAQF